MLTLIFEGHYITSPDSSVTVSALLCYVVALLHGQAIPKVVKNSGILFVAQRFMSSTSTCLSCW